MRFSVTQRQTLWLIAALTLVGACLRLFNLGDLGFRWDEDLSGLTVQAILKHGVPELPSGLFYLRGLGLSYLMAGSAVIFGFSEFALRLPPALFGIATIPMAYIFARRLISPAVGVLVAAMVSISFWDIEMGRYARMYAPFGFFYLLTLYCIWRFRVERESFRGGCLCIILALVAVFFHRLGFTLAFAFFIPELLRLDRGVPGLRRLLFPVSAFAVVGTFFWWWKEMINDQFARFALPMWQAMDEKANLVRSETGDVSLVPVGPLGNEIALPQFDFLAGLWSAVPPALLLLVVATGGFLYMTLWRYRHQQDWLQRLLLFIIAASLLTPLLNVAILALAALVFARRQGIGALGKGDLLIAASAIPAAFLVWLLFGLGFDLGGHASEGTVVALRRTVKGLLDYPRFYIFWGFVQEWPALSVAAFLGGLHVLDRAARRPVDRAALFLLLAFGIPLTLNGLLRIPYELFRYIVPLDPLFYTFAAVGILHWAEPVSRLLPAWLCISARGSTLVTVVMVAAILMTDLNPVRSWLATVRGYQQTELMRVLSVPPFPDYKTPASYVGSHAAPQDLILVLDSREMYNYLGRADYWVCSDYYEVQTYQPDDFIRDKYISTPLITDLSTLQATLAAPGTRKWLVASDRMLASTPTVNPQIKAFIGQSADRVVYTGRDGATRVYLFE